MNKKYILIIYLFILLPYYCYGATFEKRTEIPPIKLTYQDLNKIFTSLTNQLPKDDNSIDFEKIGQQLKVSDDNITINKDNNLLFSKDDQLPDISYRLNYEYYNRSNLAKITKINIDFTDYKREISIAGNSQDHVDALIAYLINKF
jgi:hypothetical protein